MNANLGERIKEARIAKHLTQRQLAEKIGAKHNSISDWENNKNKPDPDTIERLCGVLEITPNYLLGSREEEAFSPNEKALVKRYRVLDLHGKDIVHTIINKEYERILENNKKKESTKVINSEPEIETIVLTYAWNKASAGTGYFLFDDSQDENLRVVFNDVTRKADICIGVSGDSMEPEYYDGDILLVRKQPDINIGEIGIFMKGDKSYVKKKGKDGLISLNPVYEDIQPSEYEDITCYGKVLGKLEDSWRR